MFSENWHQRGVWRTFLGTTFTHILGTAVWKHDARYPYSPLFFAAHRPCQCYFGASIQDFEKPIVTITATPWLHLVCINELSINLGTISTHSMRSTHKSILLSTVISNLNESHLKEILPPASVQLLHVCR